MEKLALTDSAIQALTTKDRPYKKADANGLYLLVHPNGSKYWRVKYRHGGRQKALALGVYPDVTLEDARQARDEIREQLDQGLDPAEQRRISKRIESNADTPGRFTISNDGRLMIRIGARVLALSPDDTAELRRFLNATSTAQRKDAE